MNEERTAYLLTYLDGLTKLNASDYRCNIEIAECLKAIREELELRKTAKIYTPEMLRQMLADLEKLPND